MIVTTYKTSKISVGDTLHSILDQYLPVLQERDVVVITSKIVSICQGQVIKNDGTVDKHDLIHKEAEYYIDPEATHYDVTITIKQGTLIANSGIDESNGNNYFILWPLKPYASAQKIWIYLKKKHNLQKLGVIIVDSRTIPSRWGTIGVGIAWCGFEPLNSYIGTPDIYRRNLEMTKASVLDGLSASAVVAMGEGNEQPPLAVIRHPQFVVFTDTPPTDEEIEALKIDRKDDIYAPLINSTKWKRGGSL